MTAVEVLGRYSNPDIAICKLKAGAGSDIPIARRDITAFRTPATVD